MSQIFRGMIVGNWYIYVLRLVSRTLLGELIERDFIKFSFGSIAWH